MSFVFEVADNIYEIQPDGNELERFPLCTIYVVVDEKTALVETGCPAQVQDINEAFKKLGLDINRLAYILPTHIHIDHGGAAGHLAQQVSRAKVVTHPKTARLYSDPIVLDKLMQGFKRTFGEDAEHIYGRMIPVPGERFLMVEGGDRICLGQRTLQVIHTPGHDPNHLCFLDSQTRGLFCGDALGTYLSELDVTKPSSAPLTDPFLTLESIIKLQDLNPQILFFSHGSATGRASDVIQRFKEDTRLCAEIALKAYEAGEADELVAHKIVNVLAKNSARAKADLLAWPYLIPTLIKGYRQYFHKKIK